MTSDSPRDLPVRVGLPPRSRAGPITRQDRVTGKECTQWSASRLGFSYKKEGPKFMQRLVAKQKARVKES